MTRIYTRAPPKCYQRAARHNPLIMIIRTILTSHAAMILPRTAKDLRCLADEKVVQKRGAPFALQGTSSTAFVKAHWCVVLPPPLAQRLLTHYERLVLRAHSNTCADVRWTLDTPEGKHCFTAAQDVPCW